MPIGLQKWAKTLGVTAVALVALGCETSSHKSVRTYDYDDQGRATRGVEEQPAEREVGRSNGEIVAPGEMVSPGEMVPPGEPVVEPKRDR